MRAEKAAASRAAAASGSRRPCPLAASRREYSVRAHSRLPSSPLGRFTVQATRSGSAATTAPFGPNTLAVVFPMVKEKLRPSASSVISVGSYSANASCTWSTGAVSTESALQREKTSGAMERWSS